MVDRERAGNEWEKISRDWAGLGESLWGSLRIEDECIDLDLGWDEDDEEEGKEAESDRVEKELAQILNGTCAQQEHEHVVEPWQPHRHLTLTLDRGIVGNER